MTQYYWKRFPEAARRKRFSVGRVRDAVAVAEPPDLTIVEKNDLLLKSTTA